MFDKSHILSEIRRTAAENGGQALGRQRFADETGVRTADWLGRFWSKWSDAIAEAGLTPNKYQEAYDEAHLLQKLAVLVTELGRFPVWAELRMKARSDKEFPSHSVWTKLGPMSEQPAKLLQYCENRPELRHLSEICRKAIPAPQAADEAQEIGPATTTVGYVYLLKFRSDYKIGASNDPDRRYGEVATQMPDAMTKIHTIKTDDPFGVEGYWHRRFESKRLKGEWFKLSLADVRAFKRWKNIL